MIQSPSTIPDISNLTYPCFVSPLLNAKRSQLFLKEYVLDGYYYNNRYYISDAIPINDWNNKSCRLPFEERLKLIRIIASDLIGDYNNYIDLYVDEVNNPKELLNLYKKELKAGNLGVILRSPNGLYYWGKDETKTSYYELKNENK